MVSGLYNEASGAAARVRAMDLKAAPTRKPHPAPWNELKSSGRVHEWMSLRQRQTTSRGWTIDAARTLMIVAVASRFAVGLVLPVLGAGPHFSDSRRSAAVADGILRPLWSNSSEGARLAARGVLSTQLNLPFAASSLS